MDYAPPPPYVIEYEEASFAAGIELNKDFTILVKYSGETPITKVMNRVLETPPEDETRYEVIIRIKL